MEGRKGGRKEGRRWYNLMTRQYNQSRSGIKRDVTKEGGREAPCQPDSHTAIEALSVILVNKKEEDPNSHLQTRPRPRPAPARLPHSLSPS